MRELHRVWIGLTFLGSALACAPTAKISAEPHVVCAGRAVQLAWEGSAAGELTADPESSDLGEVTATGSKTVRPMTTTTYQFEVGSVLATRSAGTTVRVLDAPKEPVRIAPESAGEGVACIGDRMRATAHVPAEAWDKRLRVDLVTSGDGRSYRVAHQTARADVGPEASAAFRDLPIAGGWQLETVLAPGEDCAATAPESLSIRVSLICAD